MMQSYASYKAVMDEDDIYEMRRTFFAYWKRHKHLHITVRGIPRCILCGGSVCP